MEQQVQVEEVEEDEAGATSTSLIPPLQPTVTTTTCNKHRFYKTIGIDDVFLEPPQSSSRQQFVLFPQSYLSLESSSSLLPPEETTTTKEDSTSVVVSCGEIVGKIKSSPSDFIVREISLDDKDNDCRIERIMEQVISEQKSLSSSSSSSETGGGATPLTTERIEEIRQALHVADIVDIPAPPPPHNNNNARNREQRPEDEKGKKKMDEQQEEDDDVYDTTTKTPAAETEINIKEEELLSTIDRGKGREVPASSTKSMATMTTEELDNLLATSPLEVVKRVLSEAAIIDRGSSSSTPPETETGGGGGAPAASGANHNNFVDLQQNIDQVIHSLQSLESKSMERIRLLAAIADNNNNKTNNDELQNENETINTTTSTDATIVTLPSTFANANLDKGKLHKAIRFAFPLVQTKSGQRELTPEAATANPDTFQLSTENFFDELIPYLSKPLEDLPSLYKFHKRGCLFTAATSNHRRGDRQQQQKQHPQRNWKKGRNKDNNNRKRKREEEEREEERGNGDKRNDNDNQEPVLRLKPNLDKDSRRAIHHLLASKNRAFQTKTLSDYVAKKNDNSINNDSTTTTTTTTTTPSPAILVFWDPGAQHRARKKFKQQQQSRGANNNNNHGGKCNVLCVLKKREKEHLTAITALCSAVRCRTGDVGLAGIKDMKAVTYQYCTLRVSPMRLIKAIPLLKTKGIEVGTVRRVDFFLQTGDLKGNRFEITVRGIQRVHAVLNDNKVESIATGNKRIEEKFSPCEAQHLVNSFERIQRLGFVNFFGEQRVGAPGETADVGIRTFDIGRAMLQGNFSKAIDLIMTGRSLSGNNNKENPKETKVRTVWKESGGDADATLKVFPKGDNMPRERALMKGLKRYGKGDPLAAIQCLPHNVRRFWINAYQSFVWNSMVSARLKRYGCQAVIGDLFMDESNSNGKMDVNVVNADIVSVVSLEQLVLPLPGFAVKYPENDIGLLYERMLKEDGIELEKKGADESTAKGAYRHLIAKADNMHLRLEDEANGCASTMVVQFDLPAGAYATMLLREFMFTTVARG